MKNEKATNLLKQTELIAEITSQYHLGLITRGQFLDKLSTAVLEEIHLLPLSVLDLSNAKTFEDVTRIALSTANGAVYQISIDAGVEFQRH